MSRPLISICVPNLNKRPYLEERMETLLSQTFTDWEIVICDNYSDDGSWEFFQKFKNDPRIRLFQVSRHGMYAAWNNCLLRARGEYIHFATSDDSSYPPLLEKLVQPLERRKNIDVSVCDFEEIDEKSRPLPARNLAARDFLGEWMHIPSIRDGKTEFLLHVTTVGVWFSMASVLFRRSLLDKVGLFRTDRKSFADVEWSMLACLYTDIAWVPGKWSTFRVSTTQATPSSGWGDCKMYWHAIKQVIDDGPIPEQWKKLPGWESKLLDVRDRLHRVQLHSLDCYRWVARSDWPRFVRGVKKAWSEEPLWLLGQALRGFPLRGYPTTDDMEKFDLPADTHELIKFFGTKWPPEKVTQW